MMSRKQVGKTLTRFHRRHGWDGDRHGLPFLTVHRDDVGTSRILIRLNSVTPKHPNRFRIRVYRPYRRASAKTDSPARVRLKNRSSPLLHSVFASVAIRFSRLRLASESACASTRNHTAAAIPARTRRHGIAIHRCAKYVHSSITTTPHPITS